jgi:nucleoside-diphosphate-sugar epimerase
MKVVITGGRGFVGSNLIRIIKESYKWDLVVFTRSSNNEIDGVKYLSVDYHNIDTLEKGLKDCDLMIHLAATLFARNKKEYLRENVDSTKNLVSVAQKTGVKKIIYVSSLAAGGPSKDENNPRDEDMKDNPVSNYGLSKLVSENYVKKFREWVILRPPIVYGPKDDGLSTIASYVKKGFMIFPSNPASKFSFIFVEDLCRCIIRSIEDDIKNEIFYVCDPKKYTWSEFINTMADYMGVKHPVMIKLPSVLMNLFAFSYEAFSYIFKTKPVLNRDKIREAKAFHWICTAQKWEKKTGFNKWTDILDGLKKTFSKNLV